jgi:putative glycosyltransferase (TIGR04348 family)
MKRLQTVIVSPALADANNGNWQTAHRWQQMLSHKHAARVVKTWPDAQAGNDDVMLALHALKSAAAVQAWHASKGGQGLGVVLTGTDLYRDLATSTAAQASVALASQLVTLQDQAVQALPTELQHKALVIYQSTPTRQTLQKTDRHLRAVMVGHLRDEKDPLTLMAAARLLSPDTDGPMAIYIDHIGEPLDAQLGAAAQATALACPHYRWLGGQDHAVTLRSIQRAHVLVHTSRMEGGAHVLMEAICSGTPVLASRMPGNVGMLGADYSGYFEVGDARGLAALLKACRPVLSGPGATLGSSPFMQTLQQQCALRAPLFAPLNEQQALERLVEQLGNH